jgi:hypothetical protein
MEMARSGVRAVFQGHPPAPFLRVRLLYPPDAVSSPCPVFTAMHSLIRTPFLSAGRSAFAGCYAAAQRALLPPPGKRMQNIEHVLPVTVAWRRPEKRHYHGKG